MVEPDLLIPVGKIIGTHGVKGLLKVHSFSGNVESIQAAGKVSLRSIDGKLREYAVKSIAAHSDKFLVALDKFDNIDQVLELVGSELCLLRSQLPEPEEDEYYWCDLIGLAVETSEGESLGKIAEIFETGSSDIYVVRGGKREYLIPAIGDVIKSVDLKGGKVVITPLDGLLDL